MISKKDQRDILWVLGLKSNFDTDREQFIGP